MYDPRYNTRASKFNRTQWPAPDYEENSEEPIYNTHSFGEPAFIVNRHLRYNIVIGVLTLATMVAAMAIVGYLWH